MAISVDEDVLLCSDEEYEELHEVRQRFVAALELLRDQGLIYAPTSSFIDDVVDGSRDIRTVLL